MSLASETIPNTALSGREVLECMVKDFRTQLMNDCAFLPGIAYRKVAYTISVVAHLGYPHPPHNVKVRTTVSDVVTGEPPLVNPDHEAIVVGLEREAVLDNPNLARVHHDLPIKMQDRKPPKPLDLTGVLPGDIPEAVTNPFPEIENRELRYDKTQYPAATPPVDRDVSQREADKMGVRARPLMSERGKK